MVRHPNVVPVIDVALHTARRGMHASGPGGGRVQRLAHRLVRERREGQLRLRVDRKDLHARGRRPFRSVPLSQRAALELSFVWLRTPVTFRGSRRNGFASWAR